MSMEIYVLSDKRLASIADWQQALDAEGFGLQLSAERPFDALRGHLPAQLGENKEAGFECDHGDAGELIDDYGAFDFGHRWKHVLAFRWGADFAACLSAYMAAMAYAKATDGVVFDPQEGEVLTPPKALEVVRSLEKELPSIEEA